MDQGPAALRKFGILTGLAVLYVEPRHPELYIPNTARSLLLRRKGRGSIPFTLDDIATEFRENIPAEIEKWQNELIEKSVGMNAEQMLEKLFEVHGHHLIPREKREIQATIFEIPGRTPPKNSEDDEAKPKVKLEPHEPDERVRPKLSDVNSKSKEQRGDASQSGNLKSVQQRVGFPKITCIWVESSGLEDGMFASFENGGRYILTLNKEWPGIEACCGS